MLHSSLSMLQVLPVYPDGQLQLNLPLMGLVSHLEVPQQGLLIQASFRWQSRPVNSRKWLKEPSETQIYESDGKDALKLNASI